MAGAIGAELSGAETREPFAARADPHRAVGIRVDRPDALAGQAVRGRIGREAALVQARDSAAAGAEPQRAFDVLVDGEDLVAGEPIGGRVAGDLLAFDRVQ